MGKLLIDVVHMKYSANILEQNLYCSKQVKYYFYVRVCVFNIMIDWIRIPFEFTDRSPKEKVCSEYSKTKIDIH